MTPYEADLLWRRLPAIRYHLGRHVPIEVVGPDGLILENFTDSARDRAQALQRWMAVLSGRGGTPHPEAPSQ
jgi:hypothetical protein